MPAYRLLLIPSLLFVVACAHKKPTGVNVDQVQGYVNAVEKHLRAMREAMRQKDVPETRDQYEKAKEIFDNQKLILQDYPEFHDLQLSVDEAAQNICYFSVEAPLQRCFDLIRKKQIQEAQKQLQEAQDAQERCADTLIKREDYLALKMNLQTAPKAIEELQLELARPALLERLNETKSEMQKTKKKIQTMLASLQTRPNQRELAVDLDAALKELERDLSEPQEFDIEPEWKKFKASLAEQLKEIDKQRADLVRRGRLLQGVAEVFSPAQDYKRQADRMRNKRDRIGAYREALSGYERMLDLVYELLGQEASLGRYRFIYQKKKRSVTWLRNTLRKKVKQVKRKLARLGIKVKIKKRPKPRRVRRW